jgi:hypothetical protein
MSRDMNPPLSRPRWHSLALHGTISGVLVAVLWLALTDELGTPFVFPWLAWGAIAGLVAGLLAAFQALALLRMSSRWPRRVVAWCAGALLGGIVFGAAALTVMGVGILLAAGFAGIWSMSWLFLKFPLTR